MAAAAPLAVVLAAIQLICLGGLAVAENSAFDQQEAPRRSGRICIVGAGPGGLSAALFLERKGYHKVTVLEKTDRVGGRAINHKDADGTYEMGAVLKSPAYVETMKLAEEFGSGWAPLRLRRNAVSPFVPFRVPQEVLANQSDPVANAVALARYMIIMSRYTETQEDTGFGRIKNEDLSLSTLQWLLKYNLANTTMGAQLRLLMSNYGFGSLENLPMLYTSKVGSMVGMAAWVQNPSGWELSRDTYEALFERVAARLENVLLGVTITNVRRPAAGKQGSITIRYTKKGQQGTQKLSCARLITAFAQTLPAVSSVLTDMDQRERDLFAQVRVEAYTSSLLDLSEFADVLANTTSAGGGDATRNIMDSHSVLFDENRAPSLITRGINEPVLIRRAVAPEGAPFVNNNPYMFIAYTYSRTPTSEAAVRQGIVTYAPNILGVPVQDRHIKKVYLWDLFPHVNTTSIANGFYTQLEALQGVRSTYHAGALLNCDLVEGAVAYSRALVDRFF